MSIIWFVHPTSLSLLQRFNLNCYHLQTGICIQCAFHSKNATGFDKPN